MRVRISSDVEARIHRSPGRIVLQVQEASDPEAAAAALESARPAIERHALKGTGDVERIPAGPFLTATDRDDGRRRMLAVPGIVAAHLEAAGITGRIACLDQGGLLTSPLWGLPALGPAIIGRLYPPPPAIAEDPPSVVPEGWARHAATWITEGLDADHQLWAEVGLVEFSLAARHAAAFLDQQRRHRRTALVVAGRPRPATATAPAVPADVGWLCGDEPGRPVRAAALCSGPVQSHLALGAGGPATAEAVPSIVTGLSELIRRVADGLAYGFVDVAPTFLRLAGAKHAFEPFCDEAVFDGFPYQVLGPGHLDRLGGPPPGAEPIAGGRVELAVPGLHGWLGEEARAIARDPLGARRTAGCEPVKRLLRPCLDLDGEALRDERWERVQRRRLDLEDLAVPRYSFDSPDR